MQNFTQHNKKRTRNILIILHLIVIFFLILFIVGYYFMLKKKEGSSGPDKYYGIPEDEQIEYPKNEEGEPEEVEQIEDELDQISDDHEDDLDEIFDDVDSPTETLDPLLPEFQGFTTIAKTPTDTPIDIDKGAYRSPNFKYKFTFQGDNNVVIYLSGKPAVWHTGTNHSSDSFLRLESNGNLIVNRGGEKVWESGTTGGGQFLALNDQGQLAMLSEDGEVIEYIVEFHKENANISQYILNNPDLYRAFSSVNSQGKNMNNRVNPHDSANYGWNVGGIINHYINNGREEGRTMNFLTPQDNIYNEEGFQAKLMPFVNTSIENDGTQYSAFWIWKSDMPGSVGGDITGNYFSSSRMMSVPIEVVKFYYDYNHNFDVEITAKLIVQVDDRADIIHNDRYLKSVKVGGTRVVNNIVLTPGKNRFMIVCRNTGGPAGLRVVLIDPVSKQQLMNTNTNWRYIDDLYNTLGLDVTLKYNNSLGHYLQFDVNNWEGHHQYHYDYINTTGQNQQLKINFQFDDYGVLWIDRKLINSKAMGDNTPFYAIVPPGKSHICCEIMNYGGPGRLSGTIKDMQTNQTVLSMNDDGWRYIISSSKPGPWEPVTVYEHTFSGITKEFWIGHFRRNMMEAYGMPNDRITTVKVPKMLELTIWDDDDHIPKGQYSRFMTSDGQVGSRMNDRTTSLTVKTRTKDRVYFFRDWDGNNGGGGYGDTSWHIEQQGWSNFHPQMGGESIGNSGSGYNHRCKTGNCHSGDDCSSSLININNDQISSIWVPKGFKVRMWENGCYGGGHVYVGPKNHDSWETTGGLNDKVSSIKIEFGWGGTRFNVMNDYLL